MSSTELAVRNDVISSLDDVRNVARLLAASNFFDAKGTNEAAIAQLATKVLAGREMGFAPFASVNGIHVIQGKPTVSANLMAAAVKGSGRYDYRVRQMDDTAVAIEFFERTGGKLESLGTSTFTAEDAKRASTQNMSKFPRNMLFARAMSNGVRWYTPDVFSGNAVYTPDELGADVDGDGNVVEGSYHVEPPATAPAQARTAQHTAPAPSVPQNAPEAPTEEPEQGDEEPGTVETLITPEILKQLNVLGSKLYGDGWDDKRHALVEHITKGATKSSKELTVSEAQLLIAGMERKRAAQPQAVAA